MIKEFKGKYRFLSNFFPAPVKYEGELYPTVEHAYQAAKTLDKEVRHGMAHLALTPGQVKRMGKLLKLREDWEEVKLDIMYELCKLKFSSGAYKNGLLDTGDEELQEGNTWGDRFWGVCRGEGENHLGKILMKIRDEIRSNKQ